MRGEDLRDEAVERGVTAADDGAEHCVDDQVVPLVVDEEHAEGTQPRRERAEHEEELPAEVVHAEHRDDVGGHGRRDCDERLHEHGALDGVVARRVRRMRSVGDDKPRDVAHGGLPARVRRAKLVEAVKQLREPHHETVVAYVEGEVDGDGDEGEAEDGRHEQLLRVGHDVGEHGLPPLGRRVL